MAGELLFEVDARLFDVNVVRPSYGAGLLGAKASHPSILNAAQLYEIERRILAIEAVLGITVSDGQVVRAAPKPLPFDLSEMG